MHKVVIILILFVCVLPAMAQDRELRISGVFADHAVLQCGKPVPIWGRATVGVQVSVEFAGQTKTSTADSDGAWQVTLDAITASPEPCDLVVKQAGNRHTITIRNVLVGDVWLLAGGREMLKRIKDEEFGGDAPVRVFYAAHETSPEEKANLAGRWMPVSTASLKGLPAEACLLGERLAAAGDVPVGIVVAAHFNKPVESWMSRDMLDATPAAEPILRYYASDAWKIRTTGTYEERLAAWKKFNQTLPLNPPPQPRPDDVEKLPQEEPAAVWNAMVAPFTLHPIAGIVWQHGEDWQSQNRGAQQGKLLEAMIGHWRKTFGDPRLPFVVVQLPPHRYAVPFGIDGRLAAELRDGQRDAAKAAGASLAVTIDLGADPHPRDVAARVADAILAPQHTGPELVRAETVGREAILRFRNTEGGLMAKGGGDLKGFAIASSLFRWVWADARIDGETVVVSAPTVEKPQGVRYAWEDLPSRGANLCNGAGRAAVPFRTDDHLSCTADNIDPSFPVFRFNPRRDLGVEDPRLPRILIIGDSISGHYHYGVRERMRGRANVIGESSMRKGTWASMGPNFYRSDWASRGDDLKNFLAERGPFDIVHFNNGIHNFARAKPGDEKPYAEQLRKVVATIRESGAICLFANSTGTVADNTIPNAPNYLTNCRAFNAAAEEVMRQLNVPVTDIYGLIQPRIKELISSDLIHTNKEADEMMADLITKRLTETLAKLRK